MADFTREAELSIVIPDRELRRARGDLEDALADIPVGISGSGAGGGAAGTSSAREQRRRRREFRWARQRTADIETQTELLEQIADDDGGGRGGESGGGGLLTELVGVGGETAGDLAIETGDTVVDALSDVLTGTVATALGQTISGSIADSTVSVEDTELSVDDPSPLDVDDPSPLSIEDAPTLGIEEGPTLGIEDPPMLTVDKPDWAPIQVAPLEIEVGTNRTRRQPTDTPQNPRYRRGPLQTVGGALDTAAGRAVNSLPGVNEPELTRPLSRGGDPINRPAEAVGRVIDTPARVIANAIAGRPEPGERGSPYDAQPDVQASTGETNVNVNVNVDSAVQETTDELRREQERERQQVKREMEQEIERVKREITSGTSGLGAGGRIR